MRSAAALPAHSMPCACLGIFTNLCAWALLLLMHVVPGSRAGCSTNSMPQQEELPCQPVHRLMYTHFPFQAARWRSAPIQPQALHHSWQEGKLCSPLPISCLATMQRTGSNTCKALFSSLRGRAMAFRLVPRREDVSYQHKAMDLSAAQPAPASCPTQQGDAWRPQTIQLCSDCLHWPCPWQMGALCFA